MPDLPTHPIPPTHPGSGLPGPLWHPGRANDAETPNRLPLPHGCLRCGQKWSGTITSHCGAGCCNTFSRVSAFDRHRRHGGCRPPAEVGLTLVAGRHYPCWGTTEETP